MDAAHKWLGGIREPTGFVRYCLCEKFKPVDPSNPYRRALCACCGGHRREWRCPDHDLMAVPAKSKRRGIGCPICRLMPVERVRDPYDEPVGEDDDERSAGWRR
jgi:hypothetical protein